MLAEKDTLDVGTLSDKVAIHDLVETMEVYCLYPMENLKILKLCCTVGENDWKLVKEKFVNLQAVHFFVPTFQVRANESGDYNVK